MKKSNQHIKSNLLPHPFGISSNFITLTTYKARDNSDKLSRTSQNLTQILILEINEPHTDREKTARSTKFELSHLGQEINYRIESESLLHESGLCYL